MYSYEAYSGLVEDELTQQLEGKAFASEKFALKVHLGIRMGFRWCEAYLDESARIRCSEQ